MDQVQTFLAFDGDGMSRLELGNEKFDYPYAYRNFNYFSYRINEAFYQMAPYYYKPYYQNILRPQLQLYDGWLPMFHRVDEGLTPRRMLQRLNEKIVNKILPKSIDYSASDDKEMTYKQISDWAKHINFYQKAHRGCALAGAGGSSLITINHTPLAKFKYDLSMYRIDSFFVDVDSYGKVTKARIWVDSYSATVSAQNGGRKIYSLMEERFFDGDGKSWVMYKVYVRDGLINTNNKTTTPQSINFDKLEPEVRNWVISNFGMLSTKPVPLPNPNHLDCWLIHNTDGHPMFPDLPFGESIGSILFNEALTFDILGMTGNVELYLGKSKVMLPKSMINPNMPNIGGNMRRIEYQYYDAKTMGDYEPKHIQPNIRSNELKGMRDMLFEDVSFLYGLSPGTVAYFLTGSNKSTARTILEIETSNQDTADFVENKRALIKPVFDEILTQISLRMGGGEVEILFNQSRQATFETKFEAYMQMFEKRLMTAKDFVSDLFPQLSWEQKQSRIEYMESQRQSQVQQIPELPPPKDRMDSSAF
jgi:hypothetical protein